MSSHDIHRRFQLIGATPHSAERRCCMRDYRAVAEATRAQVWDRWEDGLGLSEISRTLGVRPPRVRSIVTACGGIRPPLRRRAERVLSMREREEISRGLAAGCSMREIARHLQRGSLEYQSGSGPSCWPAWLSCSDCRRARLATGASAEAVFTGTARSAASAGDTEVVDRLVATANQWLAEAGLS